MAYLRVVCLIAMVLAVFQTANSINCYTCGIGSTTACNGNTNGINSTCANSNACLQVLNPDDEVIMRGCGAEEDCDIFAYCDACTDDFCNASSSVLPTFLTVSIVGALLAKYYW